MIELRHQCCLEYMATLPDKAFDLAIVDPEFGIGIGRSPRLVTDKGLKAKSWDDKPIDASYFDELFRVSKAQIVWGANYYSMPPTKHCIIWDKEQPEALSFGMFDFAWTSFDGSNKIFRQSVRIEGNTFHPTQKPVALYRWLLKNYAKPGQRILDTHLGSGSIAIACDIEGFDLVGCEIDADYIAGARKRLADHQAQPRLFDAPTASIPEQLQLTP
jgi:site-specific DNA-methyltransferase (adenine-specific)